MTDVQKKAVQFAPKPRGMMGPRRGSVMRMQRCQESLARMHVDSNIFNKSFRVSGLKPAGETVKHYTCIPITMLHVI